jgi:hypothetical protein
MYNLHNLGWSSFQQLCLTITREVLGQTVESFLDSNDGGRDGAFAGQWHPTAHEALTGRFVIQCKFTARPNRALRPSDLTDELIKVKRLVAQGRCDSYILMTNAGLSGPSEAKITSLFKDGGARHVVCLGSTWINQQIREHKRLRMLVPRMALLRLVWARGQTRLIHAQAVAPAWSLNGEPGRCVSLPATR